MVKRRVFRRKTFRRGRKTFRKRRFRRRTFRRRKIPRGPFPAAKIAKLRWTNYYGLESTTGALSRINISCNSPYQPDSTSTRQPFGWDQWAALYNHYVVLGAKVHVYLQPLDAFGATTDAVPMVAGIRVNEDGILPYTDYKDMVASRMTKFSMIGTEKTSKRRKLMQTYSARKFFNVRDVKDNLDRLGAAVTAAPTEQAFFQLWYQSSDITTTTTMSAFVMVDYIVAFSERKNPALSAV